MIDLVLPTIGASGFYKLLTPFDNKIVPGERYTCQALRRIADYVSNNEKPLETIYLANGLTQDIYDQHVSQDMYIVSLQATTGNWLYIPAVYIESYPDTNGIPYRTVSIGVALPAIPASKNLDALMGDIRNLVMDHLGVNSKTTPVQTSKIYLVTKEFHDQKTIERDAASQARSTDRARYLSAMQMLSQANAKIAMLENYIKTHR